MYYPTLKLKQSVSYYPDHKYFHLVQIGTGGNGGYLVQRLSKLLYALSSKPNFHFTYKLVDGDMVEPNNLWRQPFVDEDVHQPKAQVLAERYGNAYDIPISYKREYIEEAKDIQQLFALEQHGFGWHIPILIGCVDNNATRQIMHQAFDRFPTMIYLDSGIDAVDEEGSSESGYSGQVVCGVKVKGREFLAPAGRVYPDILMDTDSRLPTQACGEQVVYYPQRMQTNEMAALIMNGYLNNLLSDEEIVSHYTNFNARTMVVRPSYLTQEQVAI